MKKYILLLILFPLLVIGQTEKSISYQVGEIIFDENIDGKDFKPCKYPYVYQYYNFGDGFSYLGEKLEIVEQLDSLHLQEKNNKTGYITIRFVVNCEGKIGMFRVQQMDKSYLETSFDEKFVQSLLNFTQKLNGWQKKKNEKNETRDYYQYLTYKIENGKITEILP